MTELLKVLEYPIEMDIQFQRALVTGDRRTIYPVLYYILSQLDKHKKRAYLANYLVSVDVPSHYLVGDEINGVYQKYKELQAEFQATIKNVDQLRTESASPKELQKKIGQLEQEKEQLVAKISILKKKNADKPEFQDLIQATSCLRKEQEEGSRLYEKYHPFSSC
jgi:intraflagellar transport protein 81